MGKGSPTCPLCGSTLKPLSRPGFYLCPNPKCRVIKVQLNRSMKVKRLFLEGFDSLITRKREGWGSLKIPQK